MKRVLRFFCFITVISASSNFLMAQWIQTNGPIGAEIQCFTSIGENLFIGTSGGVYLSTDNGTSWKLVGDGTVLTLAAMGTDLFISTISGVYLSTNNGATWTPAGNGLEGWPRSLAVIGSYLFAGVGGVFRSGDHGSSWTRVGPITDEIGALAVIDTVLFAQTEDAGVFRSTDFGNSWVPVNTGLPIDTAICLLAPFDTTLYAGTSIGLYRSTDYGANWTALDLVTDDMVFTSASIETTLFVGTGNGSIYSTNDGKNWHTVITGLYHTCLYASGSDFFAGTGSGVFRSTNLGESWTEFNTGLKSTKVFSLVSRDINLYAGTTSGLFRLSDSGNSWIRFGPGGFSLAISEPNFYVGHNGHVVNSMDNGASWEWVQGGGEWIRALALSGTDLFAGADGAGAGLYRFTHNAPGWWTIFQTMLQDIDVHSLAVKDMNIFAGTEKGVFLSEDNGVTWTPLNNGLQNAAVKALAINDAYLFVGTDGAGVFRSKNNGTTWTPVNTGLTDRDILSFAVSGDTVFAGTWLGGVFLSTNNGDIWRPVNKGLANHTVHSLAILDQNLYAGTRGAGVWRRPLSEMNISVRVTSPNGSESWKAESTEIVSWTSSNIQNVKIEYSTNGGSNWSPVINTAAAGPSGYPWTIPDTSSTNCLVRISDVLDANINDVSDNLFTIYQPSLVLTSPNGGENWKVGSIDTIKWISNNVQNIKIEYSANGGDDWSPVVNTIAASPSAYPWMIPDTTSTACLVRINDVLDVNINDTSDSYFSIESLPDDIIITEIGLPKKHSLLQNYPNPFNPVTRLKFSLPKAENVKIEVYNTLGQKLETLINQSMKAGYHEVEFKPANLSSGVYFYKIEAGEFHDVKKMILLR